MTRATLCRCGASQNAPFSDHSHVEAKFQATDEPPAYDGEFGTNEVGGPLTVTGFEDGPLMVKGALEITTGTGARLNVVKTAYLCRCGLSKNKPYCDGSHKDGGFKAPAL